jgi:hypothetical protein
VASQYAAMCITQDNELIRILPAQRVVYAAGNIEPVVVDSLLFHLVDYENTILPRLDDGQSRKSGSSRTFCHRNPSTYLVKSRVCAAMTEK